jgi:hypothetical protein
MATFLDQYNLLVGMYHGCHNIIKDLDNFLNFLNKLVDPNTVVPDYESPTIFIKNLDVYRTRETLRTDIGNYLITYGDNLSSSYSDALGYLTEMRNYLDVLVKVPYIQDLMPFKAIFSQKQYDAKLMTSLRDPLMQSIRVLSQSNTSTSKSGVAVKPTNVDTTNAPASALMAVVNSHVNNPAAAVALDPIKNTDIQADEKDIIASKAQQAIQQKNVQANLADPTYVGNLVNTVDTKNPSWIKTVAGAPNSINSFVTDAMGRYVTRNLVLFDSLFVTTPTQTQDDTSAALREQTRKKYGGGNLGFCDEVPDAKNPGQWILKKKAVSQQALVANRNALALKILQSNPNT